MCCGAKNRRLAVFGACLAIASSTTLALRSSHDDDNAAEVAPQLEESAPVLDRKIDDASKRRDGRTLKPETAPAGKTAKAGR